MHASSEPDVVPPQHGAPVFVTGQDGALLLHRQVACLAQAHASGSVQLSSPDSSAGPGRAGDSACPPRKDIPLIWRMRSGSAAGFKKHPGLPTRVLGFQFHGHELISKCIVLLPHEQRLVLMSVFSPPVWMPR